VTIRDTLSTDENFSAGALLGTFIGDALGMPVEGWSWRKIREHHGKVDEMLDARMGKGTYTDDTQMMIATTKSLIELDGLDPAHMAKSYLEHYDSRRGYGQGTTMVFNKWRKGQDVDRAGEEIFDGGSFGNGGSMRIAPVGVYYHDDLDALEEAVRTVCGLTHAHPLGIGSSFLQAYSGHGLSTRIPRNNYPVSSGFPISAIGFPPTLMRKGSSGKTSTRSSGTSMPVISRSRSLVLPRTPAVQVRPSNPSRRPFTPS